MLPIFEQVDGDREIAVDWFIHLRVGVGES